MYVPPNGFIGAGQQTQAAQLIELGMPRATATRRRKRKTAKRAAAPRRKRATAKRKTAKRSSSKRPARLVKGSAAAKRYMASIRRKRKR